MSFNIAFFLFSIFIIVLMVTARYTQGKKRSAQLIKKLNGTYGFWGSLRFHRNGREFRLVRLGTATESTQGSWPVLFSEIRTPENFVICPESARPFLYLVKFPRNHRVVEINSIRVVVVADQSELLEQIADKILASPVLQDALKSLFQKHFAYLRSYRELMVNKSQQVLKFQGLSEIIYSDPTQMLNSVQSLETVMQELGI